MLIFGIKLYFQAPNYKCLCSAGHSLSSDLKTCLVDTKPVLLVAKGSQIVDVPLAPNEPTKKSSFPALVGIENTKAIEYDRRMNRIFVLQQRDNEENVNSFNYWSFSDFIF